MINESIFNEEFYPNNLPNEPKDDVLSFFHDELRPDVDNGTTDGFSR